MLKDQIYMIKYQGDRLSYKQRMTVGSNVISQRDFRDTMNEEELANLNDNLMHGGFGGMGAGAEYEERSRHTFVSHAGMSQDGGIYS